MIIQLELDFNDIRGDVNMTQNDMMLRLRANVIEYHSINQQLKPIFARKEYLKAENMISMRLLGIDKADFDGLYRIEMIYHEDKVGVDEMLLRQLIGDDEVEKMREVPVDKLVKKIEKGEVGKRAMEAVIIENGNPYIKVFKLNSMKKV